VEIVIEQEKDKAVDVIMVIAFLAAALLTVIGIIFTALLIHERQYSPPRVVHQSGFQPWRRLSSRP
jgi:hypothetical protein